MPGLPVRTERPAACLCCDITPSYPPFANVTLSPYWSGTEYAPNTSRAWTFSFNTGIQGNLDKTFAVYAWAVRPGDIALVPVPAAAWLFGGALTLLGAVRRRALTTLG